MKKLRLLVFISIIVFSGVTTVKASSVSVSAASSATKGDTIKVTATINAGSGIYTTAGTLTCSGAGVSQSASLSSEDLNTASKSKSFPLSIKPTSSGTITCKATGVRIRELAAESEYALDGASTTITVTEPTVIKKPTKEYSSNNYLKSLEVEGYTISPEFSKDTKEYTVEVPNDVTKVNIKAAKEDASATISGDGEKEVSEGTNTIEVKVTAENGNERVYTITLTVKELSPIEVTIGKEKYTIIRKEGIIEPPEDYEKTTIKIGEEEVLCYKNKVTKNILIGLKDDKGNTAYYSYDEKTKKYTKYLGYKIGALNISILDMPKDKIPTGYVKTSFTYDNNKVDGYQYKPKDKIQSDFYLIYAQNEKTGSKGLYIYDKKEGTIQRLNEDLTTPYEKKADDYFLYMLIAISLFAVSVITFTTILITKSKHKKKKVKI